MSQTITSEKPNIVMSPPPPKPGAKDQYTPRVMELSAAPQIVALMVANGWTVIRYLERIE